MGGPTHYNPYLMVKFLSFTFDFDFDPDPDPDPELDKKTVLINQSLIPEYCGPINY